MKNLRWQSDYPVSYKNPHSFLFKTLVRPKNVMRAEDPGEDWIPPSDLCFMWAGTLGVLYRYSSLSDEKKTLMRKYATWVVDSNFEEDYLIELFEKAKPNIRAVADNIGAPTVTIWKQLRILEHIHNGNDSQIKFERN